MMTHSKHTHIISLAKLHYSMFITGRKPKGEKNPEMVKKNFLET